MSICFFVVLYYEDKNFLKYIIFYNNIGYIFDYYVCICNLIYICIVYYIIIVCDYILYFVLIVCIFIINVIIV